MYPPEGFALAAARPIRSSRGLGSASMSRGEGGAWPLLSSEGLTLSGVLGAVEVNRTGGRLGATRLVPPPGAVHVGGEDSFSRAWR